MSSNVDNRIVRMTFDNAKFEQGIKSTMDMLEKFEQKLKFSNSAKGFEEISKAAGKLNLTGADKAITNTNKNFDRLAEGARKNLSDMQKSLDKTDFSGLSGSATKASEAINKALSSINFDDLDKKSQETLRSMMNSAGEIDFSSITNAAGKVDFSALSSNAAVAIGAVMDLAGDVNFNGMAQNAELAMGDVNAAIGKVDFSYLGESANDAIGEVNRAADSTDLSGVSSAAVTAANATNEAISSIDMYTLVDETAEATEGFRALESVATGALMNIGRQVEDFALNKLKGLMSSITSPITEGFAEYQTQMGSIQTILANTGRSFTDDADIAEVNGVLDDLNGYADKTIYNFTEMVKNIGMFTAAGVEMYDSADAIKGIANLAALQGANSENASRAMYQMSQSLNSGVVRLMDWKSLDNASMGGQIFKDVILKAAEKSYSQQGDQGNVDLVHSIMNGETSFNESLENKWLTSDILLESFIQLTYAFGDLDDETKSLTEIERQELQEKKNAAIEHLKSLNYTDEEIEAVLELGQKAQDSATKVRTMSQLLDSLKEALGSGWTETWRIIMGDFKEATETLTKLNDALTTVIGIWDGARNNLLQEWANLGGRYVLFGGERQIYQRNEDGSIKTDENGNPLYEDEAINYTGAFDYILEAIGKPLQALKDAFSDVFGDFFTADALMDITEGFRDFTEGLVMSDTAAEGLKGVLTLLFDVIKAGLQIGSHVISIVMDIVDVIRVVTDPLFDLAALLVGELAKGLGWILDKLLEGENIVYEFAHNGLFVLWDVLQTIVDTFTSMVDLPGTIAVIEGALSGFFGALFNFEGLKDILDQAGWWIAEFFFQILDFFGLMPEVESGTSLTGYFQSIKESAETNLRSALDVIINAIPGMRDFVNVMAGDDQQKKIEFFVNIFKSIGDVVMPIIQALAAPIVILVGALRSLWDILINSAPVQNFLNWINQLKNSAIAWLLELPGKITTAATNLGQAFELLKGNLKATDVSEDVQKMADFIGNFNILTPFQLLGGGIALGLKTVIDIIKNALGSIKEFFFGWMDDAPGEVIAKVNGALANLPATLFEPFKAFKDFAKSILPDDMSGQIEAWFLNTNVSFATGVTNLILWITERTKDAETVPEAIISIVTGAWEALITSIQNFDPQEAANSILTTLDNIKNLVFGATGNFLDYIFGLETHKELNPRNGRYEDVGFTFTGFFQNIGTTISNSLDEAKKAVNSLFDDKEGSLYDKVVGFIFGTDQQQSTLEAKMGAASKNIVAGTEGMLGSVTSTATNPELTFTKISGFIDTHKFDILKPLEGIANWLDTTLFPNSDKIFTTGLNNIKRTIHDIVTAIGHFLHPIFDGMEDWPTFFSNLLENIASAIGSGLGTIWATFTAEDFSFSKWFDDIGNNIKIFIQGLREKFPVIGDIIGGIALVLEPVVSVIADVIASIGDGGLSLGEALIGAFTDIPGTLNSIWEGIKSTFGGIFDSFLTALDEKVPGAKATIETFVSDIGGLLSGLVDIVKTNGETLISGITGFIEGLGKPEQENGGVLDGLKNFFSSIWEIFDGEKFQSIANVIETLGITLLITKISSFVGALKKVILGDTKTQVDKIKDIAESVALIAASLFAIGQLNQEQFTRAELALGSIVVVIAALEGVEYAISKAATKYDVESFSSAKSSALEIAAIAAAIVVISNTDPKKLDQALQIIVILKGVLAGIDTLSNIGIAKYAGKKGLTSFAPMQNSIQEIIALALSLLILSFIPQDKLLPCTGIIALLAGILLGFQVLSNVIGATTPPNEDTVDKLGNVAIKIGIMGLLMSIGLSMLKDMKQEVLATAELGIGGILIIFGLIAKFTKADDAIKTASALVIASASVVELCLGFSLLEGMNPLTLAIAKDAVEGILVILGLILAAGSEIGKVGPMLATGGALAIASAGVIEICVGLKQLENMNAIQIAVATEGIKGIVAIIGIVNAASGSINKVGPLLASGGAFAIASAGVIEICVGLKQLENMNAIQIAVATDGIKGIVAIVGIINTVSGNISKVGPLLASGGAFAIASAGVIEICMGLQQLQGISAIEMVIYTQSIKELVAIIGIVNTVSGYIGEVGPLLASGGAFAIASFGIIEICFALQQLQGMSAIQIKWATDAIKELVAIIGVINMVSGTIGQVGPLLASGGAFAIAAAGVIEICIGLKQLEGLDPSTIKTGAEAIDSIIVVLGAVGAFLSLPIFAEGAVTLVAIAASVYMIAEGFKAFAEGIRLWLELAKDLPQLLREAKEGLEEVGKMIERWWNDMLGPELAKAIENFKKWWNETAIPAIQEFFANLPETLGKALEGIVNWAVNDAWPVIQDLFGKLAEGIGKFIEENLPKLGKAIQDAWESFTKWLGEKWAGIVKFFTEDIPKALGDLGTSIGKFFSDLHENIGKWFKEKWEAFVKWLTEDVPKWWGEQYDKVKEKLSKTWENLTTGIGKKFKEWVKETKAWWKEKWEKLLTWLGELPTKILEGIGDLAETGKNVVGGIIEGMKKAVTDNAVTRAISDVGKTISDGINGFFGVNSPSKLMRDTVGKAIPEGIGVGMTKYSKLLRKPTLKMGRSTLKSITDFFDIHSPSRLMRDKVGRYIPEGIAAGVDAYAIAAVNSAEALGSSITQAVYSGLGDISGSQYGYGISPVLDIETLKTDIEVLHEMLRIKIDEVTDLLHQKIDETLQAFEEFILEQLEAKMATDDEIFLTRLEDIKTYVEEKLSGLYEKLEGLNTSITEGLNQSIPQITEQVMSGFESVSQAVGTVGQSVSSILEALNDEQKKSVDEAITGTIVEKLEAISAALGTDVGQYAEWAHGHSNSVIDTAGKPFGILDWLVTMFDEDNFFRSIYEPTRKSIVEVIGNGQTTTGGRIDNVYGAVDSVQAGLWKEDTNVAELLDYLVYSVIGSIGSKPEETLYDITKSIEDALYVDAGTSASVAQFLDDVTKNQNTLQTYLEKILGSVDEGKGTLVDQLKATEDNGTKLDDVGQKVEEAGDKVATDYSAMKENYENHYSTYEVQQVIDRMMGTAITEEGRQNLAQGEIAFVDGQKYVM